MRPGLPNRAYTLDGIRADAAVLRYLRGDPAADVQRAGRGVSCRTLFNYLQPALGFMSTADWTDATKARVRELCESLSVKPFLTALVRRS